MWCSFNCSWSLGKIVWAISRKGTFGWRSALLISVVIWCCLGSLCRSNRYLCVVSFKTTSKSWFSSCTYLYWVSMPSWSSRFLKAVSINSFSICSQIQHVHVTWTNLKCEQKWNTAIKVIHNSMPSRTKSFRTELFMDWKCRALKEIGRNTFDHWFQRLWRLLLQTLAFVVCFSPTNWWSFYHRFYPDPRFSRGKKLLDLSIHTGKEKRHLCYPLILIICVSTFLWVSQIWWITGFLRFTRQKSVFVVCPLSTKWGCAHK